MSFNSLTVDGLCAQLEEKLERSYQSICALFCAFHRGFLPDQISLDGVGGSSRPTESWKEMLFQPYRLNVHMEMTHLYWENGGHFPCNPYQHTQEAKESFSQDETQFQILLVFELQMESALAESNEDPLQTDGRAKN